MNCSLVTATHTQDVLNVMGAVPNESTPIVRRERVERKARGGAKSPTHRYVFCDSAAWPEGVTLSTLEVDYRQLAHHLQVLGAKIELLHRVLSNHPEQSVPLLIPFFPDAFSHEPQTRNTEPTPKNC